MEAVLQMVGAVLTVASLVFMGFGVVGMFRFRDFYSRILITSKVETVGFLTLMFGVMAHGGISAFTLKVVLIGLMGIITNPLSTHAIARSAYHSGYRIEREDRADG